MSLLVFLFVCFVLNTNYNKLRHICQNNTWPFSPAHAQNQPGTVNLYRFTRCCTLIRWVLQQCPLVATPPHSGTHRSWGADWIHSCCYVQTSCQSLAALNGWCFCRSTRLHSMSWELCFPSENYDFYFLMKWHNGAHFDIYLNKIRSIIIQMFDHFYYPIWNEWRMILDVSLSVSVSLQFGRSEKPLWMLSSLLWPQTLQRRKQPKCVQAMILTPTSLQNTL